MDIQLQIKMNDKLFLRDPEHSELGKKIIGSSVKLIKESGFEVFTFKKLALYIGTTEASVYRYFENKHKLLLYLTAWYWRWLEFRVSYHTNNLIDPEIKLKKVINLLVEIDSNDFSSEYLDIHLLHEIIINEGSKAYLTKHVSEDNKAQLFKPYKDLCAVIASILLEYNKNYQYAKSLSSSLIEMAHYQAYFMKNLPSLTDCASASDYQKIIMFIEDVAFSSLKAK